MFNLFSFIFWLILFIFFFFSYLKKQSQHTYNKSWKRALHARQSESREWSNNDELQKLQQCKFKDDCKRRWHIARKQWRKIATLMQWWREDSWHYWSTNKNINVKERDEQRLFMKRNSIEADASSSTRFRRKTLYNSECIHCKECAETEDISLLKSCLDHSIKETQSWYVYIVF